MLPDDLEKLKFSRHQVHLLGREDLAAEPAAEVITPDGRRIEVSGALWAALEHVIEAAGIDMSVHILPLERWVAVETTANVCGVEVGRVRDWVAEGQLPVQPNALGDLVPLAEALALANKFRARRAAILTEMFNDPDWPDDESDVDG